MWAIFSGSLDFKQSIAPQYNSFLVARPTVSNRLLSGCLVMLMPVIRTWLEIFKLYDRFFLLLIVGHILKEVTGPNQQLDFLLRWGDAIRILK